MKKNLFITHNTSRTGAPYVLLLLLKLLKNEKKQFQNDIVFLGGGDLKQDFITVADRVYDLSKKNKKSLFHRILSFLQKKITNKNLSNEHIIKKIGGKNYDVIYANSIASLDFAVQIKKASGNKTKLIAHIHELNTVIKEYMPNFNDYVLYVDQFISVSKLVKSNLEKNWNVNPNQNLLVYEFSDKIFEENQPFLKNKPDKVFHVGASGQVHWRKGDDLFIQVANYIKKYHPEVDIKFTWVGQITDSQKNIINDDLEKANLKETVFFVGEQNQPEEYFKSFDVFLMTSREDPFPLVCIEVGKIGIPIVCFKNATGTEEIIKDKGGFVVPYLDCIAMAKKIIEYYHSESLRLEHGNYNKESFSIFSSNSMAPKIIDCIKNI